MEKKQIVVVGAGFWGCTIAERIASVWKQPVLVVERRNHIGGNSWSTEDPETGIEVQRYGTHVFHTSNQEVWDYVSSFDTWNHHAYRVQSMWKGKRYQLPINLNTIEAFYGMRLTQESARELIEREASSSGIVHPHNCEEKNDIPYRPPPVRGVLPRIYAQTMGKGSIGVADGNG